MDRSEVIELISKTRIKNKLGVYETTETAKEVFCSVESIGSAEFFRAGEAGLKPTLKFTMFRYDYNSEECLNYKGVKYNIYRTYVKQGEEIELYCSKDIGTL